MHILPKHAHFHCECENYFKCEYVSVFQRINYMSHQGAGEALNKDFNEYIECQHLVK